nr:hypothetical protein CFP56_64789 [Quercus suber]
MVRHRSLLNQEDLTANGEIPECQEQQPVRCHAWLPRGWALPFLSVLPMAAPPLHGESKAGSSSLLPSDHSPVPPPQH